MDIYTTYEYTEIEKEKKLVIEKLLTHWKWLLDTWQEDGGEIAELKIGRGRGTSQIDVKNWNPQSERKWWPEIWEKMDAVMIYKYKGEMEGIWENLYGNSIPSPFWFYHTAKPEVCWKALIKTLGNIEKVRNLLNQGFDKSK